MRCVLKLKSPKCVQKCVCGRSPPGPRRGILQRSPSPQPFWGKGAGKGRRGKEKEREGEGRGRGTVGVSGVSCVFGVCGCRCCAVMRQCRPMMVRSEKQYRFIYDVLFDALLTHHADVSDDVNVSYRLLNRVNPHTNQSYFHEQFKVNPQAFSVTFS